MKSCFHIQARRYVESTEGLGYHPWNGYPYFFPRGKGGGTECSIEYRNSACYAFSGFFTKVGTETGVSGATTGDINLSTYNASELLVRATKNLGQPIVDIPLFLFELKDVKRLLYSARNCVARARKVLPSDHNGVIGLKDLASSYLGYEFGLRPLVSDMLAVFELLTKFNKKFEQYLRRAQKLNSAQAHVELATGSIFIPTEVGLQTVGQVLENRIRVTVRYREHSNALDDIASRVAYLLDSLGARLSARTVWNAIPFSFIFDWFLNVDSFLNQLDDSASKLEIVDACITFKLSKQRRLEIVDPTMPLVAPTVAAGEDFSIFRRHPIAGHIVAQVLTENGLVGKRLALSAALLLANNPAANVPTKIETLITACIKRQRRNKRNATRLKRLVERAESRKVFGRRRYGRPKRAQ